MCLVVTAIEGGKLKFEVFDQARYVIIFLFTQEHVCKLVVLQI